MSNVANEELINDYEEIVKDVEKGVNLPAHLFTVIHNQNRLSALADLHWQNMDDSAYNRLAFIAYKYYKLQQAITIAMQAKFVRNDGLTK